MAAHPHSPTYSDTPTYYQPRSSGDLWRTDGQSAVDWLGNTFKLGDMVIYCIGAGSGQIMAVGEVQQIRTMSTTVWKYDHKTKQRWTEPDVEVEVLVLTKKTSSYSENQERAKPAWVNPMNITALANIIIDS